MSGKYKKSKKRLTEELSGLKYNPIYYQPKEIPDLKLEDALYLDKFNAKLKALDEYNLTEEEKKILTWFTYRFIRIDFETVANYYYFQASEEMKKAMERLRLVLVDDGSVEGFIEDELLRISEKTRDYLEGLDYEGGGNDKL